jgi:hypothetical protein
MAAEGIMRKRTPIRGCLLVKRDTLKKLHGAAATVHAEYVCTHMAQKLTKSRSRWGDTASGHVKGFGSVLMCRGCFHANVFWQDGVRTVIARSGNYEAKLTLAAKAGK